MRPKPLSLLAALALLGMAGCSETSKRDFDRSAGASLDAGTFGNATMNNHLVATCQARYADGKYAGKSAGGTNRCADHRTLDGKYAQVIYNETVESATTIPVVTTSISVQGGGAGN